MLRLQGEFATSNSGNTRNAEAGLADREVRTTSGEADELAPAPEPPLQRLLLALPPAAAAVADVDADVDANGDGDHVGSSRQRGGEGEQASGTQLAAAAAALSEPPHALLCAPPHDADALLAQLADVDEHTVGALRERSLARRTATAADSLGRLVTGFLLFSYGFF